MPVQRLTDRLSSYWGSLQKEGAIPAFESFNQAAIRDVWDQCMLISVKDDNPDHPAYDYYQVGAKAKTIQNSRNAAIVERLSEVISTLKPLYESGQYMNAASHLVKFRSCLLPFGHDGHVTHVVVGLSWREFD